MFYGLVESPGAGVVSARAPTLRTALTDVLGAVRDIRRCVGCTKAIPDEMLQEDHCPSCNIREALCTKTMTCSICQEETVHFLTTVCGHHFHPQCLISTKKVWIQEHWDEFNSDELKFPCPNCRGDLPDNYNCE
jgi:hypothetical protein